MDDRSHYQKLINMYAAAKLNDFFCPVLKIEEGAAQVEIELSEKFHHAAGAVHGSVYFKMLDDAAFFAANSLEPDYFLLTTSFTTYITRPVVSGRLRSVGKVVNRTKSQFITEAVVYDGEDKEIGRGNGIFVRGRMRLAEVNGYN